MNNYTTSDKLSKIDVKDVEALKAEQAKTLISSDAYAITDLIEQLIQKIEHARVSLI